MEFRKVFTPNGLIFLLVFTVLTFIGQQVNFSKVVGAESQFFTLFQFFGPVAGAFLGPIVGVLAVLIAQLGSLLYGSQQFTLVTLLRLLPMLFAAWYFGTKKDKASILVPIAAIILFIAHPVGRQVWFFSLFWTIPIIIKLLPQKYSSQPFLSALGATFTAHAVGGSMWNYLVPMTPELWIGLIPVVIYERLLFTVGIGISYYIFNTVLDRITVKDKAEFVNVDRKYTFFKHAA